MIDQGEGVSIIICCHNSENRIEQTLKHIFAQQQIETFKCELIIVDNNSTDNTIAVSEVFIKSNKNSNIKAKIVLEKRLGLSNARKTGVVNSQYDIIMFCDDDNWFNNLYIFNSYCFLRENNDYAIVGGNGIERCEIKPPKWFNRYKSIYALGCRKNGDVSNVYGAGMAVRKKLIYNFESKMSDRVGKSLISGGDSEICLSMINRGYKIRQLCNNKFYHFIPKERLTKHYLMRMASGRGASKAMLMLVKYNNNKSKTGLGYRLKIDVNDIIKVILKFNWIDIEFTFRRILNYWKIMLIQ